MLTPELEHAIRLIQSLMVMARKGSERFIIGQLDSDTTFRCRYYCDQLSICIRSGKRKFIHNLALMDDLDGVIPDWNLYPSITVIELHDEKKPDGVTHVSHSNIKIDIDVECILLQRIIDISMVSVTIVGYMNE